MATPQFWFRQSSRPGGTVIPRCWQGWALVAATPLAILIGVACLSAISTLAVLIGLPVIALTSVWAIGSVITRRLEPPGFPPQR